MDFKGLWRAVIEIVELQLQYWKEIVVLIFGVILLMSFIIWVWSRFGWIRLVDGCLEIVVV